MLVKLLSDYRIDDTSKLEMLMIGDASGKPGQFSDSDKQTAIKFGIDYLDVEDFIYEQINQTIMEEKLFDFGQAIKELKAGNAIARKGWNGKDLFVVKQIPSRIEGLIIDKVQSLPNSAKEILKQREGVPHIDYTNQMLIVNPDGRADSWVPSVSDIFAEDWFVRMYN